MKKERRLNAVCVKSLCKLKFISISYVFYFLICSSSFSSGLSRISRFLAIAFLKVSDKAKVHMKTRAASDNIMRIYLAEKMEG